MDKGIEMERKSVSSSSLASIGYGAESETLEVEFVKDGSVYEYYNVPQVVYEELMAAPSVGVYFNAEIKNSYASNRV